MERRDILRYVSRTALLLVATLLLGWLDALTGPDPTFVLLYLLPVIVAGWWLGRAAAVVVAVVAGTAWLLGDLPSGASHPVVLAWEGFSRATLFAVVGTLVAEVHRDRDRLLESNARLAELLTREADLARTDPLTRLPNSRAFMEQLEREIARCRRSGSPLSIGYVDLDDFKRVNDLYGHAAGDALLEDVGATLRESLRAGDMPARLGGDEFAVLFARTDIEQAEAVGQRLVARIHALGERWPLARTGASIGIVSVESPPGDPRDVVALADRTMYRAKHAGKGLVRVTRLRPVPAEITPVAARRGPPHAPSGGRGRPA